jgi:hypothetical protein
LWYPLLLHCSRSFLKFGCTVIDWNPKYTDRKTTQKMEIWPYSPVLLSCASCLCRHHVYSWSVSSDFLSIHWTLIQITTSTSDCQIFGVLNDIRNRDFMFDCRLLSVPSDRLILNHHSELFRDQVNEIVHQWHLDGFPSADREPFGVQKSFKHLFVFVIASYQSDEWLGCGWTGLLGEQWADGHCVRALLFWKWSTLPGIFSWIGKSSILRDWRGGFS